MKLFERLAEGERLERVGEALDTMQLAHKAVLGVEGNSITLLSFLYNYLEGLGTHARVLFLDFSFAFNTIQPHVLARKVLNNFKFNVNFEL